MQLEDVLLAPDTRANQPAASSVAQGTLYCVTDEANILEWADRANNLWLPYGVVGDATLPISLATDVTGDLPFTNLTQIAGLSVLGVTGNSTADVAAITAGTDGHVLTRSGTTLVFAAPAGGGGSGAVVQVKNVQTGAVATGSTIIPDDDTIPQITEGNEYMTLAITPTSATNKLKVDVVFSGSNSNGVQWMCAALFQDTTVDALAAAREYNQVATAYATVAFSYWMTAGTTSSTTFRVRGGAHLAGTTTFNGQGGNRRLGGVHMSSITITEIVP